MNLSDDPQIPPPSIRVVLVDDYRSMLWALERLIESAAPRLKTVGTATTRAEAIRCVAAQQPDIVVLDPDLDGDNVIDLIPQFAHSGRTRLIVLTGGRDRESSERAVIAGARGLLHKSVPPEHILSAIEKVHQGQLWLDDGIVMRVFATLTRERERRAESPRHAALTVAEQKIISALVEHRGAPNKVIASSLHISDHTLRNHLASIYSKLGVHRRLDLVLFTLEHGLHKRIDAV
jgi:two-component system, NarL family, nitrate/nitrite response regulator NarL